MMMLFVKKSYCIIKENTNDKEFKIIPTHKYFNYHPLYEIGVYIPGFNSE